MKSDTIYNKADNRVFVKTNGNQIYVICNKESQQKKVIEKMCTDNCILEDYEQWDDGDDMKWVLTFRVIDEYEKKVELN